MFDTGKPVERAPDDLRSASEKVVVYLPDNAVRQGYVSLVKDIARELFDSRWLTLQLFKRDVLAFYKQSLLGAFWMVLVPLITVGTFVVLRGSGVVAAGEMSAPYPIYATIGVGVWQLFAQGLVAGANSLVQGSDMITRVNFSKKSLVIASQGRTVVSFAVLVVLVLALFGVYVARGYSYSPSAAALLVPFALIPTIMLTIGLSLYLALLNGVVRDIGTMLAVVVTFLMLLTPVLYQRPSPDGGALASLLNTMTEYNPMYYLVITPRELILQGTISEPVGFAVSSVAAFVIMLVALFGFHLTETRIAERI